MKILMLGGGLKLCGMYLTSFDLNDLCERVCSDVGATCFSNEQYISSLFQDYKIDKKSSLLNRIIGYSSQVVDIKYLGLVDTVVMDTARKA